MRSNIGISALFVLLAASAATGALIAQQPATSPAQKPSAAVAAQQSPYHPVHRTPKEPYPAHSVNQSSKPVAPTPAPANKGATPAIHTPTVVKAAPTVAVAAAPAASPTTAAPEKPADPVQPPVELKVVCTGDQLSITANNTTLGNVLNEVKRCSGAQVDAPGNAYSTKIYDNLGPGPVREVLDALLSNSGFDYVIGASDTTPGKIESILLITHSAETAKSGVGSSEDMKGVSTNRRAFAQMRDAARPHPPEEQAEAEAAIAAGSGSPAADPPPVTDSVPSAGSPAGAGAPADPNPASGAAPGGSQPGPAQTQGSDSDSSVPPANAPAQQAAENDNPARDSHPPTTEQQIVNMEQLFQQRQQMVQQQNQQQKPQ